VLNLQDTSHSDYTPASAPVSPSPDASGQTSSARAELDSQLQPQESVDADTVSANRDIDFEAHMSAAASFVGEMESETNHSLDLDLELDTSNSDLNFALFELPATAPSAPSDPTAVNSSELGETLKDGKALFGRITQDIKPDNPNIEPQAKLAATVVNTAQEGELLTQRQSQ